MATFDFLSSVFSGISSVTSPANDYYSAGDDDYYYSGDDDVPLQPAAATTPIIERNTQVELGTVPSVTDAEQRPISLVSPTKQAQAQNQAGGFGGAIWDYLGIGHTLRSGINFKLKKELDLLPPAVNRVESETVVTQSQPHNAQYEQPINEFYLKASIGVLVLGAVIYLASRRG